jgi:hypothetical protein
VGSHSPQPGRLVDLFANAVSPAWPHAIEHLDASLIDLGLEVEDEPFPASKLDLNAQRSKLCDRLLRLAAIRREDPVTPLLPGHPLKPCQYRLLPFTLPAAEGIARRARPTVIPRKGREMELRCRPSPKRSLPQGVGK